MFRYYYVASTTLEEILEAYPKMFPFSPGINGHRCYMRGNISYVNYRLIFTLPMKISAPPYELYTIKTLEVHTSLDWDIGVPMYIRNDGMDDFWQCELDFSLTGTTGDWGFGYKFKAVTQDGNEYWFKDPKTTSGVEIKIDDFGNSYCAVMMLKSSEKGYDEEEAYKIASDYYKSALWRYDQNCSDKIRFAPPRLENYMYLKEMHLVRNGAVPKDVWMKKDVWCVKVDSLGYCNRGSQTITWER